MTGAEFAAHYPRWEDYKKIRRELDPEGKFLNPYLKSILT
jgi:FAD/FMN-containing dehydrogenase